MAYGPNQTSELSTGVVLPRFKGFVNPLKARAFLLSQDWLEFSSYKERMAGLSLTLFSTRHHDMVYNLGWRTLTDQSQMASKSIRRQLGHGLLSSLKYTFTLDRRNSQLRPTRGYSFVSSTHVGGLAPDSRSVRFLRQVSTHPFVLVFCWLVHLSVRSNIVSNSISCLYSGTWNPYGSEINRKEKIIYDPWIRFRVFYRPG